MEDNLNLPPLPSMSKTRTKGGTGGAKGINVGGGSTGGINKVVIHSTKKATVMESIDEDSFSSKVNNDLTIPSLPIIAKSKLTAKTTSSSRSTASAIVDNSNKENKMNINITNGAEKPSLEPEKQRYKNSQSSTNKIASSPSPPLLSTSTPPNTIQRRSSRVLRSCETMEDFFCLNLIISSSISTSSSPQSPSSHDVTTFDKVKYERIKGMCHDIVNGGYDASNDIQKWKEVLLYVFQHANNGSESMGFNLIRLHKRAISRFGTSVNIQPKSSNQHTSTKNDEYEKDLVTIWLQYAKVQYKYRPEVVEEEKAANNEEVMIKRRKDTLSIFKLLQNKNLGQQMAEYYIAMADFELDTDTTFNTNSINCDGNDKKKNNNVTINAIKNAIDIIEGGIKNGAEPNELLNIHLEKLQKQKIKILNETDTNGKSIKCHEQTSLLKTLELKPEATKSDDIVINESVPDQDLKTEKLLQTTTSTSVSSSSVVSNYLSRPKKRPITSLRTKINRNTNASSGALSGGGKLMGGPPKRISAVDDDEDDEGDSDVNIDDSDDSLEAIATKKRKVNFLDKKPEKITRASIGYLLNWNPSRMQEQGKDDIEDKEESSFNQNVRKSFQPSMEKIDESTKEHQSTGTSSQNTSSTGSRDLSNTTNQQTTETSVLGKKEKSEKQSDSRKIDESFTELPKQILSEKSPPSAVNEFLPLISEKKMIKVNGLKYIKLSVIGKGGSCKVYRTLTKDGQNVAIKKVNLVGIQKKAIIGFANEIKLLKRLRGNPAIIQLHDSEVNLEKKVIYLVMEIGEIDLNHVLREQVVNNNEQTVNMNFIRLIWQQMLSAVHCIHKERIIHGDLKPANFLFVKGVLKLIDFGIAKAIQCDNTTNIYRDSQIGTLNYMSPESIQGTSGGQKLKCGKPSDVWSLGCILYQMCYGKTPFADISNMIQKLHAIIDPAHEINYPATIPPSAIDAIKSCLQRKPEDRSPIVGENGLLNQHRFLNYLD